MGQMQPVQAQAVVADAPPPVACGPYGCVPEPGYADVAPGYVADSGYVADDGYVVEEEYVESGYVAEPGYAEVAPPAYVPPGPAYTMAVGPDCYWKRGVLGNLKQRCD